ncbi:GNAT family N-acetyltransferase [Nocardioides sp. BP30]|uniref:GNAT family N-acetyltransferase n=1 Tax=Nocardioides sp. BP30 TaxID=3036374 RepID=UPI002468AF5F|nr:GNAT family N-acetyltransferase [Nocardioides sp. BP30]WGL51450.1 GNAT family N-acetyltransferase [Nocardioides sp. BP30]
MSGFVVRIARADDAAAFGLLRLVWAAENGADTADPGFAERLTSWFAAETSHRVFWLAEAGDEAVGMVNLTLFTRMPYPASVDLPTAWGYLANLFVRPAERGRGIGAALIGACTTYAEDHRLARIVLSPSPASTPLYRRAGFSAADTLMVRTFG